MPEQRIVLEHEADAALAQAELAGIDVAKEHLSRFGLFKPGHGAQQRRLAGTRRPQQRHEFARRDIERDALQGRIAAIVLFEVSDLHGNGHGESP